MNDINGAAKSEGQHPSLTENVKNLNLNEENSHGEKTLQKCCRRLLHDESTLYISCCM